MFTSLGSIFTLLFIAIDRYRKVCLPFKRQLHMRHMKSFVVPIILGGALFFAWPSLLVYGLRSAETGYPGLTGRDCSASEALRGTLVPLIYNSVLFGGFIVIVAALACLYCKVLRGVRRLNRNRLLRRKRNSAGGGDSVNSLTSTPRRARELRRNENKEKETEEMKNKNLAKNRDRFCIGSLKNYCKEKGKAKEGKVGETEGNGWVPKDADPQQEEDDKALKGGDGGINIYLSEDCPRKNGIVKTRSPHTDENMSSAKRARYIQDSNQNALRERGKNHNRKVAGGESGPKCRRHHGISTDPDPGQKSCKRRLKRQFSFPAATTHQVFTANDISGLPSLTESAHMSPFIRLIRRNVYSSVQISDSCPILQSPNAQSQKSGDLKVCHTNEGFRCPTLSNKYHHKPHQISKRRRSLSEIVRGQRMSQSDYDILKSDANISGNEEMFKELKAPTPNNGGHLTVTEHATGSKKDLDIHLSHPRSQTLSFYARTTPNLPEIDEGSKPNIVHKCNNSSMKRGKILRFTFDNQSQTEATEKQSNSLDMQTSQQKEDIPDGNPELLCLTVNGDGQERYSRHSSTGFNKENCKTHNELYQINQSCTKSSSNAVNTQSEANWRKPSLITKRDRAFLPLALTRTCRKLPSVCPPSSVIETTTTDANTTTTVKDSKTETKTAASSSCSFTAALASSSTLDSHFSRVSSSPPDEIERSTSSTSYSGRHRHNDSRKLRGHSRGQGPRSRTTTIALLVTLIFVASFLPHLCLQAAQLINDGFAANLKGVASLAYNTFLRSYFINSAANPILYGILNIKFSAEVRALLGRGRGPV